MPSVPGDPEVGKLEVIFFTSSSKGTLSVFKVVFGEMSSTSAVHSRVNARKKCVKTFSGFLDSFCQNSISVYNGIECGLVG